MNTASKFFRYFLLLFFHLKFLALMTVMTLLYLRFFVAIYDPWPLFARMGTGLLRGVHSGGLLYSSFREPMALHFSLRIKLENSQQLV